MISHPLTGGGSVLLENSHWKTGNCEAADFGRAAESYSNILKKMEESRQSYAGSQDGVENFFSAAGSSVRAGFILSITGLLERNAAQTLRKT
jgi:hypothetical protein